MRALALVACAGCASFEDPTIVLDLRVLGMETTPPEQILDVDLERQPTFEDLLEQMVPIRVRAVIAEPGRTASLGWTLTACALDEEDGQRCRDDVLSFEFAGGVLPDPETSSLGNACEGGQPEPGGVVCGTLVPDNRLVNMFAQVLREDVARGLGGIDLGISLRMFSVDEHVIPETYAAKRVRFAPRIPSERLPNRNPHIEQLLLGINGVGFDAQKAHCADRGPVDSVSYGERVTLFPVPREGDKERYVLPTLDGQSQELQEYLTYQWIATHGSFTDEITGGAPDVFGNVRLDGTEWEAPEEDALVTVWVLQRDARYGVRWREACIKVGP